MLIAGIYPLMTVYTVRGGQRKGSKHVINFPQNVSRLATVLPQIPRDIPLIVRRANLNEDKHYDFRVRRSKIERALRWLKIHNKWYRDVTISNEQLSQLPIDDNLEHLFARQTDDLNLPEGQVTPDAQPPAQPPAAVQNDNIEETMGMTFCLYILTLKNTSKTLSPKFTLECHWLYFNKDQRMRKLNDFFRNLLPKRMVKSLWRIMHPLQHLWIQCDGLLKT